MRCSLLISLLFAAAAIASGQDFYPLSEVRAGQQGVARTVFQGTEIEEFGVEVLGVLENVGPKQSLIIVRLSGEKVAKTGVMSGMSGSPVYIDGRLAGAIAFSFPFATDPLAGVRPIEDMTAAAATQPAALDGSGPLLALEGRGESLLPYEPLSRSADVLTPIATPVSFGGFSARTLDVFGDQLRALGLRPMQGIGGGQVDTDTAPIEPGSMIAVGLIRGDMNVNAAGTVTYVDGEQIYAFGHPFLSSGPARLPMMRSSVLASVASLQNSFKLAGSGGVVGSINTDRSTGIIGTLGESPELTPFRIRVDSEGTELAYDLEIVDDPALTPFLVQIASFSAIDATERQVGALTIRFEGQAALKGLPPLSLDGLFAGPSTVGQIAALNMAATLGFLMQAGPDPPQVESIDLKISVRQQDRRATIVRAWAEKERIKAGESLQLNAVVRLPDGTEKLEHISWQAPFSTAPGPLKVTLSDGSALNMLDIPLLFEASRLNPARVVESLNSLRQADQLYLRVWRPQRGLRVETARLSSPPASLRAILDTPRGAAGGASPEASTTLHESVVATYDAVIEGQQTIEVTISE
ncbi:MAG: hypothetical protein O3A53_15035 [Acidobacteria bacterium]|nr:hypothetical protein [Acidobacteriota bacterium]MDA1236101.1 hypothetical protein [Acidobacteriota bacterium]